MRKPHLEEPGCRCGSKLYCRVHMCYGVEKDIYVKDDFVKPERKEKKPDGRSDKRSIAKHKNRKKLAYRPSV